jgi:hypothetical protein
MPGGRARVLDAALAGGAIRVDGNVGRATLLDESSPFEDALGGGEMPT